MYVIPLLSAQHPGNTYITLSMLKFSFESSGGREGFCLLPAAPSTSLENTAIYHTGCFLASKSKLFTTLGACRLRKHCSSCARCPLHARSRYYGPVRRHLYVRNRCSRFVLSAPCALEVVATSLISATCTLEIAAPDLLRTTF